MSPSLPPEIIIKILELATSPSHADSARNGDQLFLQRCCLVSKQLCSIARPMLWSAFSIKMNGVNISSLSSLPHLARHIRVLTFRHLAMDGDEACSIAEAMPSLVEGRFNGALETTKKQLASMQHLQHLFLSITSIASSSSVHFSNLVSLTLYHVRPNWYSSDQILFAPASFPALKALYLDFYQVHADDIDAHPGDLHQRGHILLLTFDTFDVKPFLDAERKEFEHFQINVPGGGLAALQTSGYLGRLVRFVKASVTVKSLSLPISFSPSTTVSSLAASARDELLHICTERKIDII